MAIKIRNVLSEPFVQFLFLGVLLYVFVYFLQQKKDKQSREIIVSSDQVGRMLINYKMQMGELPTKKQLDALIDNYIREEISYREARKMGLDKDDEIIHRRLVQKYNFIQTDLVETKQPTEEDLINYYNSHPQLFQKEATVSFSHIYFSPDNSTDSVAKQRALSVLQDLKKTNLQRAPEKGDRFPLQYDYTDQARVDIRQNFGDKPIEGELFSGPLHVWLGPVLSGYGWHLIFITRRGSPDELPFASVKQEVRNHYMDSVKAAQNEKIFDRVSEKYIIKREYLDSK